VSQVDALGEPSAAYYVEKEQGNMWGPVIKDNTYTGDYQKLDEYPRMGYYLKMIIESAGYGTHEVVTLGKYPVLPERNRELLKRIKERLGQDSAVTYQVGRLLDLI